MELKNGILSTIGQNSPKIERNEESEKLNRIDKNWKIVEKKKIRNKSKNSLKKSHFPFEFSFIDSGQLKNAVLTKIS